MSFWTNQPVDMEKEKALFPPTTEERNRKVAIDSAQRKLREVVRDLLYAGDTGRAQTIADVHRVLFTKGEG